MLAYIIASFLGGWMALYARELTLIPSPAALRHSLRSGVNHSLPAAPSPPSAITVADPAVAVVEALARAVDKLARAVKTPAAAAPAPAAAPAAPAADGCYHVYLDLGTNTAVQFHKLYDPDSLPPGEASTIIPKFNHYFGSDAAARREDVCGFGFEPNPSHQSILRQTTAHYAAAGARLTIFESAVGTFAGWGSVVSDGAFEHNEWGTTIVPVPATAPPPGSVHVVDIAAWFAANIQHRQRPPQGARSLPPALVAKIDIEGTDESVMGKLFASGALCTFDYIYVEQHVRPDVLDFFARELRATGCATVMEFQDDEAHHTFKPAWMH